MSAALSTTGKTLRYAMVVVTGLFLFLGLWKMPALDLNLAGKVIGWLVLLLLLGINCMVASTLIGIALSHADPAESPGAIKDA